jgi:hypothetical protein
MLMKKWTVFVVGSLIFSLGISSFAQSSDSSRDIFSSKIFLRKVIKKDHGLHFEVCEHGVKSCKILTREITPQEMKSEQILLEKNSQAHFRLPIRPGTVFFSENVTCTIAGAVIAAVPGYAGGSVICFNSQTQKLNSIDLPLHIMALNQLAQDLGEPAEEIARGEEGDVYMGNLSLIFNYLKNRYPPF